MNEKYFVLEGSGISGEGKRVSILRRERELHNWSQVDLVQQILELCAKDGEQPGLTVKTVGRWERGVCKPSSYYRRRLCQLFGKNAVQLGFIE